MFAQANHEGTNVPVWFKIGEPSARNGDVQIVEIPRRITHPRRLFAIFVRELAFPSYFGWNWDAFEECLCDLDWLPADRRIILLHQDLPFVQESRSRAIYCDILARAEESGSRIECWIRGSCGK